MRKRKFNVNYKCFVAGFLCAASLITSGCGGNQTANKNTHEEELNSESDCEAMDITDADYVLETNYTGANAPVELYRVPFQKTDMYISNTELSDKLSEKEMEEYLDTAEAYLTHVYGNSYVKIGAAQDSFTDTVDRFIGEAKPSGEDGSDMIMMYGEADAGSRRYSEELLEMYMDNRIDAAATIKSDTSLVYQDVGQVFVRSAMTVNVSGDESCRAYADYFGIELTDKKPATVITEVSFYPNNPKCIATMSVIGRIDG